jgi:hypothetical protein
VIVQRLGRGSPAQGLAGAGIEGGGDSGEVVGAVPAQVGALWEVLAEQAVGVFVGAVLPWAVRVVELAAHDYHQPCKPDCAWDEPQATQALVSGLVTDALTVLEAVAEVDVDAEQAEAVALLALVAGQDVEPGDRPGTWRIARKVAKDRVISTVDPQARHAHKTSPAARRL